MWSQWIYSILILRWKGLNATLTFIMAHKVFIIMKMSNDRDTESFHHKCFFQTILKTQGSQESLTECMLGSLLIHWSRFFTDLFDELTEFCTVHSKEAMVCLFLGSYFYLGVLTEQNLTGVLKHTFS